MNRARKTSWWKLLKWRMSKGHLRMEAARCRRAGQVMVGLHTLLGTNMTALLILDLIRRVPDVQMRSVMELRLLRNLTAPPKSQ